MHRGLMRGAFGVRPVVLATVFAAASVLAVPSALSQGSGSTYADPAGDGSTAGDITGVNVSADNGSGQILFRISGTNLAASPTQLTVLSIDSDANPVTGDIGLAGADYTFAVGSDGYGFEHFDGHDWVDTPYSTVQIGGGTTDLLISVNRSELGNTSDFNFTVHTFDEATNTGDDAPDGGAYNYSLPDGGPLITAVVTQMTPTIGPKAGRSFVLKPIGLKLPPDGGVVSILPQPDSYSCRATLKGARLAGAGQGGCSFRLTSKARGKSLAIVLSVTYEGATKAFPYRFRVG